MKKERESIDGDDDTEVGLPIAGEVIAGKYRVQKVLGVGGMGVVVAAQHIHLGQLVAVKFLLPDTAREPEPIARFVREARALATLRSEHIVRVIDVDTMPNGAPYIVMEHLVGTDLGEIIYGKPGPLSIETAIDYVLQICEALAEAHAVGIVHRDLKPSNMFLTKRTDGAPLVKILDFGIAKKLETDPTEMKLTSTGAAMGSPLYMSPEQIHGSRDVDERSDIWSLGVILHELVSARAPFEAPTVHALCARIIVHPPTPLRRHLASAPKAFEEIILRCLEKDSAKRFSDVGALARALSPLARFDARQSVERIWRTRRESSLNQVAVGQTSSPSDASTGSGAWATKMSPGAQEFQSGSGPKRVAVDVVDARGATSTAASGEQLRDPSGARRSPVAATARSGEARPGTTTSEAVSSDAPTRRKSKRAPAIIGLVCGALVAATVAFFVLRSLSPTGSAARVDAPAATNASAPLPVVSTSAPSASAAPVSQPPVVTVAPVEAPPPSASSASGTAPKNDFPRSTAAHHQPVQSLPPYVPPAYAAPPLPPPPPPATTGLFDGRK